jgi:hypothetical protein
VGQVYTQLAPGHDLTLADLSSVALRGLGVQRSQVIDTEKTLVLFGDRVGPGSLRQLSPSTSLANDAECYGNLLDLAEILGVFIVPGRDAAQEESDE